MESARYNIFTKKKRNPKVLALPLNICKSYATQHTWDHLQVTFWKATPIMKVLQVGVSFEMKYLYQSLLKVVLLHLSKLQCRYKIQGKNHTGQCKRTGGCYNDLVVTFFRLVDGLKGKKSIPDDFMIYL